MALLILSVRELAMDHMYTIFFSVKHILKKDIADLAIFTESSSAFVCIRDRFVAPSSPYLVHYITRILV